jgi:hypothetical protein
VALSKVATLNPLVQFKARDCRFVAVVASESLIMVSRTKLKFHSQGSSCTALPFALPFLQLPAVLALLASKLVPKLCLRLPCKFGMQCESFQKEAVCAGPISPWIFVGCSFGGSKLEHLDCKKRMRVKVPLLVSVLNSF